MRKGLCSSIAATVLSFDVSACEIGKIGELFEYVCVGSQLQQEQIGQIAQQRAKYYGMSFEPFPRQLSKQLGVDEGWAISYKNLETYFVSFGHDEKRKYCTVSVKNEIKELLRSYIEEKYSNSRKIADEVQGASSVLVYSVDLWGYAKGAIISIQAICVALSSYVCAVRAQRFSR